MLRLGHKLWCYPLQALPVELEGRRALRITKVCLQLLSIAGVFNDVTEYAAWSPREGCLPPLPAPLVASATCGVMPLLHLAQH